MKASLDQFYEAGDVISADEELLGLDATAHDMEEALIVPPTTTTPIIYDETTNFTITIIVLFDSALLVSL